MNRKRRHFVRSWVLALVCLLSISRQSAPQVGKVKPLKQNAVAQSKHAMELRAWSQVLLRDYPRVAELPVGLPGAANDRLLTADAVNLLLVQIRSCSQPARPVRPANPRAEVDSPFCLTDSERARILEFVRTEGHTKDDPLYGTGEDTRDNARIGLPRYSARSPILFLNGTTVSKAGIDSNDEIAGAQTALSHGRLLLPSQRIFTIAELIFYDLSRTNYSALKAEDIPPGMITFIDQELSKLVSAAPTTLRTRFPVIRLKLGTVVSGPLLLMGSQRSDPQPFIQISPLLVRTLFFYCLSRTAQLDGLLNPKTLDKEFERIASLVLGELASQLHFFLAHELGHIYLDTDDEHQCDDFGFDLVKSVDKRVSLDAVQLLFQRPTEDTDVRILWGLERPEDGEAVSARMSRLAQKQKSSRLKSKLTSEFPVLIIRTYPYWRKRS